MPKPEHQRLRSPEESKWVAEVAPTLFHARKLPTRVQQLATSVKPDIVQLDRKWRFLSSLPRCLLKQVRPTFPPFKSS